MGDIRNKVIPYWFPWRVHRRIGFHVRRHIQRPDRESHDGGVALGNELVFGESFDVEEEVRWKRVEEPISFSHAQMFLRSHAVILGEDGCERDLRNDVAVKLILEERGGGEVESQH